MKTSRKAPFTRQLTPRGVTFEETLSQNRRSFGTESLRRRAHQIQQLQEETQAPTQAHSSFTIPINIENKPQGTVSGFDLLAAAAEVIENTPQVTGTSGNRNGIEITQLNQENAT